MSHTSKLLKSYKPGDRIVCDRAPFIGQPVHWNPRSDFDPSPFSLGVFRYNGSECKLEKPVAYLSAADGSFWFCPSCAKDMNPDDLLSEFRGDGTAVILCDSCGSAIKA
ncbi:MAG: hypothetical protein EPO09_21545 [Aquabacterium sp.]|uniref:hypothetical protein n=1 Tax=Aquabacterium sp. TaxID=1872578 RepID=UPI001211445F|nr:hypothetical protein [Aquabacterium sp.]TAK82630.1 MAG: hypothetical protein EPO09_21545 [Aquabacterium sp.]